MRIDVQRERYTMITQGTREAEAVLHQYPGIIGGVPQKGRRGFRRDVRVERGKRRAIFPRSRTHGGCPIGLLPWAREYPVDQGVAEHEKIRA